jgi:hypothetical protein
MLSTKNISESARIPKGLNPGKHEIKILEISLGKGYEADSYHVNLSVEGPDLGDDFEGFLIDRNDPTGPRFRGQIGRVQMSQFAYKDGVTKTGYKKNRDQDILKALSALAVALGRKEQLDQIEADTIEEFVAEASHVLSGDTYINAVIAGKEYEKNGYKQYNLFFPASKDGKYAFEPQTVDPAKSKLMSFDPNIHIVGKTAAKPLDSFEPTQESTTVLEDEFKL